MFSLSAVEKTALLTACKRRVVDPVTYARLLELYPDLILQVVDNIEHDDVYSLELQIRQTLVMDAVLKAAGDVIVELGCGLSSLGRDASNTLDVSVIEVDLPGVIEIRKKVIAKSHRKRLDVLPGDVTDPKLWDKIRTAIPEGARVCVVCEGLLRYFSMDEKAIIGRRVYELIKPDGFWISCDVTLSEMLEVEQSNPDIRDRELASTVFEIGSRNAFQSKNECISFFSSIGFLVDMFSASDAIPELSQHLPERTSEEIVEASKFVNVIVMKRS